MGGSVVLASNWEAVEGCRDDSELGQLAGTRDSVDDETGADDGMERYFWKTGTYFGNHK